MNPSVAPPAGRWLNGGHGATALDGLPPARERPPRAVDEPMAAPDNVNLDDWNDMLCAIKTRMREMVAVHLAEDAGLAPALIRARVEAGVLDCATALDQLHTTLLHELSRRQATERELVDTRDALERSLEELAGTQAEEREARHPAHHDSLTQLPNRSHFHERLERALALAHLPQSALTLLYIDLDGFKPINDLHGHDTGDTLLCIVATRLRHALRAGDMVGHLGGDEFACLLNGELDHDKLLQLAGKLFDIVSAPLRIGHLQLSVNPSIGIATCAAPGQSADALLKIADAAMCRAKRQHSAFALFDPQLDG